MKSAEEWADELISNQVHIIRIVQRARSAVVFIIALSGCGMLSVAVEIPTDLN